jgi:ribokinase
VAVRTAVIGHLEWSRFALVERVPQPGGIVHVERTWDAVGGTGAVSAVQLARLGAACTLFTALGDDEPGRRVRAALEEQGVPVEASVRRDEGTREAFTLLDAAGERTIVVLGRETLGPRGSDDVPWHELEGVDAALFVSGDGASAHHARRARVMVASGRGVAAMREAGVVPDALVRSREDERERYAPGDLAAPPSLVVETGGAAGGRWWDDAGAEGRYSAAPLPGPLVDDFGAGDCFVAALCFGLGEGRTVDDALALAARAGAACLTGRAPLGGLLDAASARGAVAP